MSIIVLKTKGNSLTWDFGESNSGYDESTNLMTYKNGRSYPKEDIMECFKKGNKVVVLGYDIDGNKIGERMYSYNGLKFYIDVMLNEARNIFAFVEDSEPKGLKLYRIDFSIWNLSYSGTYTDTRLSVGYSKENAIKRAKAQYDIRDVQDVEAEEITDVCGFNVTLSY